MQGSSIKVCEKDSERYGLSLVSFDKILTGQRRGEWCRRVCSGVHRDMSIFLFFSSRFSGNITGIDKLTQQVSVFCDRVLKISVIRGKIWLRIKDCPGNCSAGFFLRADLAYRVCPRSSRPSAHLAEQIINRRDFLYPPLRDVSFAPLNKLHGRRVAQDFYGINKCFDILAPDHFRPDLFYLRINFIDGDTRAHDNRYVSTHIIIRSSYKAKRQDEVGKMKVLTFFNGNSSGRRGHRPGPARVILQGLVIVRLCS
jgi:hypothetical protein